MSVHSIEEDIADALAFREAATKAGITDAQARSFAASLFEMPVRQTMRIMLAAHKQLARAKTLSASKRRPR